MNTLLYGEFPQLGDAARTTSIIGAGAGAASASIAAGGTTVAALTAIGVGAQAVPVVGTILGAVALAAAGVAKLLSARKVAKGLHKEKEKLYQAIDLIRKANGDADKIIGDLQAKISQVNAQLKQSGLGSLEGRFGTWIKKTFTPKKYAEKETKKAVATYDDQYPKLEAELNTKIATIQKMQVDFDRLQQQFTKRSSSSILNNLLPGGMSQAGGMGLALLGLLLVGGLIIKKVKSN
jgi:prefoldin subunit 5